MKYKVFVGGLPSDIKESDIHDAFDKCGTIMGIQIRASKSDTFCFIDFRSKNGQERACDMFDNETVCGNVVKVQIAKETWEDGASWSSAQRAAMQTFRPGDWICSRCDALNFARREHCYACVAKKQVRNEVWRPKREGSEVPRPRRHAASREGRDQRDGRPRRGREASGGADGSPDRPGAERLLLCYDDGVQEVYWNGFGGSSSSASPSPAASADGRGGARASRSRSRPRKSRADAVAKDDALRIVDVRDVRDVRDERDDGGSRRRAGRRSRSRSDRARAAAAAMAAVAGAGGSSASSSAAAAATASTTDRGGEGSPSARIWVGGLPHTVTEREILEVFSEVGGAPAVIKLWHPPKGATKGTYAFVQYQDDDSAQNAIFRFDDEVLWGGLKVRVRPADPRGPLVSMERPKSDCARLEYKFSAHAARAVSKLDGKRVSGGARLSVCREAEPMPAPALASVTSGEKPLAATAADGAGAGGGAAAEADAAAGSPGAARQAALQITSGVTSAVSRVSLKEAMESFGEVVVCTMGSRCDPDKVEPFVVFKEASAAEAALLAMSKGDVKLEGKDYGPLRGERVTSGVNFCKTTSKAGLDVGSRTIFRDLERRQRHRRSRPRRHRSSSSSSSSASPAADDAAAGVGPACGTAPMLE
eukprot:TRINITY_DN45823_c0_g1_i1.p1 TRINITY_DN45823_c0_g1~~TRINITY_DN45823_c0_g1_i1.p1  ORF type:complete len:682 (-),score=163.53 TRINITY_DN45823_c0_g1_i1:29-1975(-)